MPPTKHIFYEMGLFEDLLHDLDFLFIYYNFR